MFSSSSHDKKLFGPLIKVISRSSFGNSYQVIESKSFPKPTPDNYKILRNEQVHNYCIIEIQYADCNNFEGKKILVFWDCTITDLEKQKLIDPHFCDNPDYHSPVARFIPNDFGWKMAKLLCETEYNQRVK